MNHSRSRLYRLPAVLLLYGLFAQGVSQSSVAGTLPIVVPADSNSVVSSPDWRTFSRPGAQFEPLEPAAEPAEFQESSSDLSVTVDVNTATAATLADRLPGIGPSKARAIIEWRDKNGPFQTAEQLLDVPGIGPSTLAKIRPLISFGQAVSVRSHEMGANNRAVIVALGKVIQNAIDDAVEGERENP